MDSYYLNTKIQVFPTDRLRIKNKKRQYSDEVIIGKVSDDLCNYYISLIYRKYGVLLEKPPFGAHITICDGRKKIDTEKHSQYLSQLNNKQFKVLCDPKIYLHWKFFAIKIYSKELSNIRKNLNLSEDYPFHITIGKIPDKFSKFDNLTRLIDFSELTYE